MTLHKPSTNKQDISYYEVLKIVEVPAGLFGYNHGYRKNGLIQH